MAEQSRRENLTTTQSVPSTRGAIDRVAKPVKNSREAQERDSGTYTESGEVVVLDDEQVEIEHPATVVNNDEVNARIKGSWTMVWGDRTYEFQDGKRTKIPRDLFNYLKAYQNIYDTM